MSFQTIYSLDVPIYPNLVKKNYGIVSRISNGFIFTVRDITMHITYLTLGRVLQLSTEGVETRVYDEREATLRLILGRKDVGPLDVVSANQLPLEMRLLHSIVTHILFPKIDRFDFILERDLIIMHYILDEYPLNLPKLMITHMIKGSTKRNACLSYGMILTLLFRDFKVPISKDEPKRLLRHTDIYSNQSYLHGVLKNK